jgi:Protein of unknown function (DUF2442)
MSTVISIEPRVKAVSVTDDRITFELVDGRTVSVPLAWSWRLSDATPEQKAHYEIIGDGQGVRKTSGELSRPTLGSSGRTGSLGSRLV